MLRVAGFSAFCGKTRGSGSANYEHSKGWELRASRRKLRPISGARCPFRRRSDTIFNLRSVQFDFVRPPPSFFILSRLQLVAIEVDSIALKIN